MLEKVAVNDENFLEIMWNWRRRRIASPWTMLYCVLIDVPTFT